MVPTNVMRVELFTAGTSGLPPDEITFAELVKEKGYSTGYVGQKLYYSTLYYHILYYIICI